MQNFNRLFPISFLMIAALLFGASDWTQAKQAPPNVPPGSKLVGPHLHGTMIFFKEVLGEVETQKVRFVGACQNVSIDETVVFEWMQDPPAPALEKTDLIVKGNDPFSQVVEIDDPDLVNLLNDCYKDNAEGYLFQFTSVKQFKEVVIDNVYTAEVSLGRLVPK